MKKKAVVLFAFIILASCGTESAAPDPAPNKNGAEAAKTATSPGRFFRATLIANPEPNHYNVKLEWEILPPRSETWILQRKDSKGSITTLWRFESGVLAVTDTQVTPGESYTYSLALSEDVTWHPLDQTTLTIPIDFEVTGIQQTRGIHAQRLFLRANSVLRIEDQAVEIKVDEIMAEGGILETFAPNQIAAAGQNGRSGGELTLKARTGKGLLTISARGEDGGPGTKGSSGATGTTGDRGTAAQLDLIDQALLDMISFRDIPIPPHPPSLPFRRIHFPLPPPQNTIWRAIYTCKHPPSAGLPGGLGGPGQKGKPGGKGGNTGDILVDIDSREAIQVVPVMIPGKGGIGEGGDGGRRGPNGPSGDGDIYGLCPRPEASIALPGDGPRGESMTAEPGHAGAFCLRSKGAAIGECGKWKKRTAL